MPIDPKSFKINTGKGEASWHMSGVPIEDYGTVTNAVVDGPSIASTVSFNLHWGGVQKKVEITNANNKGSGGFGTGGWGGKLLVTGATSEWSAQQPGFSFRSDPGSTSVPEVAVIVEERNGVFFH